MIELEFLQCVTGCYRSPEENDLTFTKRFITEIEILSDEVFYSLSKETQVWINKTIVGIRRGKYE